MVNRFQRLVLALLLGSLAACAPATTPVPPPPPTQAPSPTSTQVTTRAPRPTATSAPAPSPTAAQAASNQPTLLRDKIKHIIVIMQENRSFDTYFGTYPGADGIPMQNGVPTVCINDPGTKQCVKPYHDAQDINAGGPHASASANTDIDGRKMDGFITAFRQGAKACKSKNPDTPGCVAGKTPDVMGWHDAREIPNYWTYAQNFVLQDKMFEPNS